MASTTEIAAPTAESFGYEVSTPGKAPYGRIQANGKTLCYVSSRRDGVLLDFSAASIEKAPKAFTSKLESKGARATMRVTDKNAKAAQTGLDWLAKQVA